jgi:hypothetical protein
VAGDLRNNKIDPTLAKPSEKPTAIKKGLAELFGGMAEDF